MQTEIDQLRGRPTEAGSRTRDASGRSTPQGVDGELSRRFTALQSQHSSLQAELAASRDILSAREREAELLRKRLQDAEGEMSALRDELAQAHQRINTLLEVRHAGGPGADSEDGSISLSRTISGAESDEEASMAYDKVSPLPRSRRGRADALAVYERAKAVGAIAVAGFGE